MPKKQEVKEMTIPNLVNEYVERRMGSARGEVLNARQHARHCAVVDELRARKVLN